MVYVNNVIYFGGLDPHGVSLTSRKDRASLGILCTCCHTSLLVEVNAICTNPLEGENRKCISCLSWILWCVPPSTYSDFNLYPCTVKTVTMKLTALLSSASLISESLNLKMVLETSQTIVSFYIETVFMYDFWMF